MTCTEALDLLLEADPETLAGRGESPLTAHLRSCAHCQATATRLLAAHQHDSMAYLGVAARRAPGAVAELVMATPNVEAQMRPRRSRGWRVGFALVPLAAAAALLLVVTARRDARREAFQASMDAAFAASTAVTNVKVPPGRNAVVFKTRDPNISVVWIY